MEGREASPDDAAALAAFVCTQSHSRWALEVQGYARGARTWQAEEDCNRVKVFYGGDGRLAAVLGYCAIVSDDPSAGFFVAFLAVALHAQRQHFATDIFENLKRELATQAPGGRLVWRVHGKNQPSNDLFTELGHGAEWEVLADWKPYRTYATVLPGEPLP